MNQYVDPANPNAPPVFAPSTNAVPAESVQWRTENYTEVLDLSSLDRALTNDTSLGVMRYADAGYEESRDEARKKGLAWFDLSAG